MKFSTSASLFVCLGSVIAGDFEIRVRAPIAVPAMTVGNAPVLTQSYTCGAKTYTGADIVTAIKYGEALRRLGETRGRGRGGAAASAVGSSGYPQSLYSDDSKGLALTFPNVCPADVDRFEYPLFSGAQNPYDGGTSNTKYGDERVVFYISEAGEIDAEKNGFDVFFCGMMTHTGAPTKGGFVVC